MANYFKRKNLESMPEIKTGSQKYKFSVNKKSKRYNLICYCKCELIQEHIDD